MKYDFVAKTIQAFTQIQLTCNWVYVCMYVVYVVHDTNEWENSARLVTCIILFALRISPVHEVFICSMCKYNVWCQRHFSCHQQTKHEVKRWMYRTSPPVAKPEHLTTSEPNQKRAFPTESIENVR